MRRTQELLEEIRERGNRWFAPESWELLMFIRRLAEVVDDLETLEVERQAKEFE